MAQSREETQARLYINRTQTRFEDLARQMVSGTLPLRQWAVEMEKELRTLHLGVAVIANGEGQRLSSDVEQIARQMADSEIGFLRQWVDSLAGVKLTDANLPRILQRAGQYAQAALETFARVQASKQGLPELPFFPKQRTLCHRNCKCHWDIRQLDGRGNYDCTWMLAPAEHCITCLARSRTANPLQVRNGVIQNPEKYTDPVLFGATASVLG